MKLFVVCSEAAVVAFLNSRLPSLVCQLNHGLLDCLFLLFFVCLKQFAAMSRKCSVNLLLVSITVEVILLWSRASP